MKAKAKLRSLLLSWDFVLAVVAVVGIAFVVPGGIEYYIAKEIFEISTSVFSIVFSVFFAALATIMTAGDNDFVRFLEEENLYKHIVWTFKFTLFSLLVSLLLSIILLISVLPYDKLQPQHLPLYPESAFLLFSGLGLYSLFATVNASLDAIKYAEYRARFIQIMDLTQDRK